MNRIKKAFALFLVLIGCFAAISTADSAHSRWEYDIQYRGVLTSDLSLEIIGSAAEFEADSMLVRCETHNNGIYQRLFRVENEYETLLIPSQNELPLFLKKVIKQKNIQQEWKVSYDHGNGNATIDSLYKWAIPLNCHNYFSMLVFLQKQSLNIGDTYQFALDTESKLWQVTVNVKAVEKIRVPFGNFMGSHLVLSFQPINEAHVREWKTDLMTNRFANPKEAMHIWFDNSPERKIIRIDYNSKTKMRLRNVTTY